MAVAHPIAEHTGMRTHGPDRVIRPCADRTGSVLPSAPVTLLKNPADLDQDAQKMIKSSVLHVKAGCAARVGTPKETEEKSPYVNGAGEVSAAAPLPAGEGLPEHGERERGDNIETH